MLALSKYVTNYTELLDLGVRVLGLGNHEVNSAKTDFPKVNEAAYSLLQSWAKQQSSPQEAFRLLSMSLKDIKWNQASYVLENLVTPKLHVSGMK